MEACGALGCVGAATHTPAHPRTPPKNVYSREAARCRSSQSCIFHKSTKHIQPPAAAAMRAAAGATTNNVQKNHALRPVAGRGRLGVQSLARMPRLGLSNPIPRQQPRLAPLLGRRTLSQSHVVCNAHSAVPPAQGLFDPANDKDSCGEISICNQRACLERAGLGAEISRTGRGDFQKCLKTFGVPPRALRLLKLYI